MCRRWPGRPPGGLLARAHDRRARQARDGEEQRDEREQHQSREGQDDLQAEPRLHARPAPPPRVRPERRLRCLADSRPGTAHTLTLPKTRGKGTLGRSAGVPVRTLASSRLLFQSALSLRSSVRPACSSPHSRFARACGPACSSPHSRFARACGLGCADASRVHAATARCPLPREPGRVALGARPSAGDCRRRRADAPGVRLPEARRPSRRGRLRDRGRHGRRGGSAPSPTGCSRRSRNASSIACSARRPRFACGCRRPSFGYRPRTASIGPSWSSSPPR